MKEIDLAIHSDSRLAMEDNLVGHFSYLQQHTEGMVVRESPSLVLVSSGLPTDTFNVVYCRKSASAAAIAYVQVEIENNQLHP